MAELTSCDDKRETCAKTYSHITAPNTEYQNHMCAMNMHNVCIIYMKQKTPMSKSLFWKTLRKISTHVSQYKFTQTTENTLWNIIYTVYT